MSHARAGGVIAVIITTSHHTFAYSLLLFLRLLAVMVAVCTAANPKPPNP